MTTFFSLQRGDQGLIKHEWKNARRSCGNRGDIRSAGQESLLGMVEKNAEGAFRSSSASCAPRCLEIMFRLQQQDQRVGQVATRLSSP